eukprot:CAMPEP_0184371908 /NCGR_PEP_ID=MMETSP1089-20130417/163661_1 /TAXON_ID=38269 ORGANISM="Gloeochaete wittrockiana, Strain SAG46.84" /NCGR_SAMPLE_ID=MMETSP1089 /ASSEMBLY_ACC=CAM_ASM_000445 /LENGTH=56 /DNA_ID=CAMNT_0026714715 /DNA_START=1312 /DNA_END=1482 /DNA_ORIENTATION=+
MGVEGVGMELARIVHSMATAPVVHPPRLGSHHPRLRLRRKAEGPDTPWRCYIVGGF